MIEKVSAKIILDYSGIENDFKKANVLNRGDHRDHGDQDTLATLQNYIDLLKKSAHTLELIKDSLSDDEFDKVEFGVSSIDDKLEISGDAEIVERFVGFGIAEYDSDDDFMDSDDESESSDSSSESSESSDSSDSSESE